MKQLLLAILTLSILFIGVQTTNAASVVYRPCDNYRACAGVVTPMQIRTPDPVVAAFMDMWREGMTLAEVVAIYDIATYYFGE